VLFPNGAGSRIEREPRRGRSSPQRPPYPDPTPAVVGRLCRSAGNWRYGAFVCRNQRGDGPDAVPRIKAEMAA
jgi:hypothetical protein